MVGAGFNGLYQLYHRRKREFSVIAPDLRHRKMLTSIAIGACLLPIITAYPAKIACFLFGLFLLFYLVAGQ
jgi:hypothetical protein